MSDANGPYKIGRPEEYDGTQDYISPRLVGPGLGRWWAPEISDLMETEKDLEALTNLVNNVYAEGRKAGRASRDGLREELLYVKGYCDCASTRSIEKALEADGEGR
ncbi:MAG: hypothetical protein JNK54_06425 [Elusimicrobia bacterium]|nr:hypothetical protein [Elusimicrobiota bacterium]